MKFRGRKVLQQVVHTDLREKTFAESLIISLKSIFEQRHCELSYTVQDEILARVLFGEMHRETL